MKKCNICERNVEDDVRICPHCGHDFSYKHVKNQAAFEERFAAPDMPRDALGKTLISFADEYKSNKEDKVFVSLLDFEGIKNRTVEEETRIYTLETKNRNIVLIIFSIIAIIISAIILYSQNSRDMFLRIGMYLCIICTILALVMFCLGKRKILQDLAIAMVFSQYAYIVKTYLVNRYSDVHFSHYLYIILGVAIAAKYYKKIGKIYPICVLFFMIGGFEILVGYYIIRVINLISSGDNQIVNFILANSCDLAFSMLAGGFFLVFIYDILSWKKEKQ